MDGRNPQKRGRQDTVSPNDVKKKRTVNPSDSEPDSVSSSAHDSEKAGSCDDDSLNTTASSEESEFGQDTSRSATTEKDSSDAQDGDPNSSYGGEDSEGNEGPLVASGSSSEHENIPAPIDIDEGGGDIGVIVNAHQQDEELEEAEDRLDPIVAALADGSEPEADISDSEDDVTDQESEGELMSESSDEEDVGEQAAEGDRLIYPGAPITLHESLLAIFTLSSVEHITGVLLGKILELIAIHCMPDNICKRTLYKFKKYFAQLGDSLFVYHYYCSNCIHPVPSKGSACPKCQSTEGHSFFLEMPLINQLRTLFKRRGFFEDLQFRFNPHRKRKEENIEDIYDGNIYKQEMDSGFLENSNNISFMWYSDGVSVFKSSSFSLWPVYLVINELSYKQRVQPRNILVAALWFGKSKPNPNVFLAPLEQSLRHLKTEGCTVTLHDNSEIVVKGKVLCGTCDLPAKSAFLCFKQFNRFYGCCSCLSAGKTYGTGPGSVHVYPYSRNMEARTHEQIPELAEQALQLRSVDRDASVLGVKGPSLLYTMVPDLIRCTAIDIMHGVFLGVCKLLTSLWFSSTYSTFPWTLHHYQDIIEKRLKSIKPPSNIQRTPRSLTDISRWKASDFKLFLMVYSIPLLSGLMDDRYFKHHCKLVSSIFLLSQDSVSLSHVAVAKTLLHSYVSDFANLYHLKFMGINVHQLLHLPNCVLDLGPLWVYSCFFLESLNGKITKLFHGTQHIAVQICSSMTAFMELPIRIQSLPLQSPSRLYCNNLMKGQVSFKIADIISEKVFAVGTYATPRAQILLSVNILRHSFGFDEAGNCSIFYRLRKDGIMYFCEEYGRISVRKDSTYISFKLNDTLEVGRIVRFVKRSYCRAQCAVGCRQCEIGYFAIVRKYEKQVWYPQLTHDVDLRLPYISEVKNTGNLFAVPVENIINFCFHMKFGEREYISQPINRLEVE